MTSAPQSLEFSKSVGWSTITRLMITKHQGICPASNKNSKKAEKRIFINYFSDLIFEQPDDKGVLPVALPVMTLLVFENNNEHMVSMFSESWKKATKN